MDCLGDECQAFCDNGGCARLDKGYKHTTNVFLNKNIGQDEIQLGNGVVKFNKPDKVGDKCEE
jgi:hypothetical protein